MSQRGNRAIEGNRAIWWEFILGMRDGAGEGLEAPFVPPSPQLCHKEPEVSRQPQPGPCHELSPAQLTVGPEEAKGTF